MGWCLGPTATRKAIDVIRNDFDKEINEAKILIEEQSQSMNDEDEEEGNQNSEPSSRNVLSPSGQNELTQTNVRRRLFDVSNKTEQNQHQQEHHPGYSFCWDNIGRHLTVRQQTTDHQNKYHMWALAYAAVNRVQTTNLPTDDHVPASTIPLKSFLPSDEDIIDLKKRLIFEVESIAAEYLQAFKSHSPKPFTHQHTAVMDKKSHLINLGIIQENPSSTAGTIAILQKLHTSVGKDVSKCFNHAVDLLNQVTDSFTLLHLMQLMQIDDIEDIPPDFPKTASAQKVFLNHKATQLIESIWHNCGAESLDPAEIPRDDNSQICN
ncbi:unnamed protein product [Mytilus coruscus]|uniref:Uncharacterized protein n=1 Tax=Mytilus coruscus TaxID=42192 RepID=A0A6J8D1T5_MYTCO|nr:unnamed protein product [Mytilus coruscus]